MACVTMSSCGTTATSALSLSLCIQQDKHWIKSSERLPAGISPNPTHPYPSHCLLSSPRGKESDLLTFFTQTLVDDFSEHLMAYKKTLSASPGTADTHCVCNAQPWACHGSKVVHSTIPSDQNFQCADIWPKMILDRLSVLAYPLSVSSKLYIWVHVCVWVHHSTSVF